VGILTGNAIAEAFVAGDIEIDPYDPARLAPNSYDLALGPDLLVYDVQKPIHDHWEYYGPFRQSSNPDVPSSDVLDMRIKPTVARLKIRDTGTVLWPGVLYLGSTVERIHSDKYVPAIEGRSSAARLGLHTHISAGWGDIGFDGCFTLELSATVPLRVYAGVRICQVSFSEAVGRVEGYKGKYSGATGPQESGLWKDFI